MTFSQIILALELHFLFGVGIGSVLPLPLAIVAMIGAVIYLGRLAGSIRVVYRGFFLLCGLVGCLYSAQTKQFFEHPPIAEGQPIIIEGTVVNFPETTRTGSRFPVRIPALDGHEIRVTSTAPPPAFGAAVRASGQFRGPEDTDTFQESRYFLGKGLLGSLDATELTLVSPPPTWKQKTELLRGRSIDVVEDYLVEPEASLALGVTLGISPTVDPTLSAALKTVNLTHIAAASGQNLSLTALVLCALLRRVSVHLAILLSLLFIGWYAILVGAQMSIVRAGIMTGIFLLGPIFGRPIEPVRLLIFTLTCMVLGRPLSLVYDLSLILSFSAMLGLVLVTPLLEKRLQVFPVGLRLPLSATLAVTAISAPIQLVTFGTLSPLGPVANLLVTPLIPLAMAGGFVTIALGATIPVLGPIVGMINYPALHGIVIVAQTIAAWPVSQLLFYLTPAVKVSIMVIELVLVIRLIYRRVQPRGGAYR